MAQRTIGFWIGNASPSTKVWLPLPIKASYEADCAKVHTLVTEKQRFGSSDALSYPAMLLPVGIGLGRI